MSCPKVVIKLSEAVKNADADDDDDDDDDGEEVPHFYISKLPIVRLCGCYW